MRAMMPGEHVREVSPWLGDHTSRRGRRRRSGVGGFQALSLVPSQVFDIDFGGEEKDSGQMEVNGVLLEWWGI